jgi:hypothetical protein
MRTFSIIMTMTIFWQVYPVAIIPVRTWRYRSYGRFGELRLIAFDMSRGMWRFYI